MNFSSGNPVNISGGQVVAMEGGSAISDNTGQLLFYTDGINVWTRNHTIMVNGQGLAGGSGSSTQSSLIIPKTSDRKQYYIFTADEEGSTKGFQYSIVDISLNNGLGEVIVKNQRLVTPCSEKVTAVRHCNKKDYWVITHKFGSDAYYAYLATENGVAANPVISHTGSNIPVAYFVMAGQIKASPDGKKIIAMHSSVGAELSDFNNQTGAISNTVEIFRNANGHHAGAEFSADSKMLYLEIHGYWSQADFTRLSGTFQYQLSLPAITDIINSKYEVFRYTPLDGSCVMQRGPNGKIYISKNNRSYLSVVNAPQLAGAACNFVNVGVSLPFQGASLPNFINDYTGTVDTFSIVGNNFCTNRPVAFTYAATNSVATLRWDFGDPVSGGQNSAVTANAAHVYTTPGNYTIKLIKLTPCGNDTLSKQLSIGAVQISLGNDTAICEQSLYTITPQTTGATSFLWHDNSTASSYTASTAGLFWVQASNSANGCIKRDSILITTKPLPKVNLGPDTSLCQGAGLLLSAASPAARYVWQDNSTNADFQVNHAGTYWVDVNLNDCKKRDSITVVSATKPQFTLGPDQYLCPGLSLLLNPGLHNVSYRWQNGDTTSAFRVQTTGVFSVEITNPCGASHDSIYISPGNCTVWVPSAFTPNNDGLNDRFQVLGTSQIAEFELTICNRYGQVLFHSTNKEGYWDGNFKHEKLPAGGYIYLLKYKDLLSGDKNLLKGTILLMR